MPSPEKPRDLSRGVVTRPPKDELARTVAYFEAMLHKEADDVALSTMSSFQAGVTTLDQIAEARGLSEGLRASVALMQQHLDTLGE